MKIEQLEFRYYSNIPFGGANLILVNIKHVRRNLVRPGVIESADHFSNIFSNGLYMQVPFEVWCEL